MAGMLGRARDVLVGMATAVGVGVIAASGLLGLFTLLDDSSIVPHRTLSRSAAIRFLIGLSALMTGYVMAMAAAWKRGRSWSYRFPLVAVSLAVLGWMLLNPFTQCALEAVNRPAATQR
jgi:hypothetical protein